MDLCGPRVLQMGRRDLKRLVLDLSSPRAWETVNGGLRSGILGQLVLLQLVVMWLFLPQGESAVQTVTYSRSSLLLGHRGAKLTPLQHVQRIAAKLVPQGTCNG